MYDIFWISGNPVPRQPLNEDLFVHSMTMSIPGDTSGDIAGGLAIVKCPRGDERLEEEVLQIKLGGIQTLVSLVPAHEAEWLGISGEQAAAKKFGLEFLSHPIFDGYVPKKIPDFRTLVAGLAERLRAGRHVGIHCRASIGRATIGAACTLIQLGWKAEEALNAVEKVRGCPVPDTEEQRRWILAYQAQAPAHRVS